MNQSKPKPPSPPLKPERTPTPPSRTNPGAERWQRTVRYGWDKGGARGGKR